MDVRIAVPDEHVSKPILDAGLEMNTRVNEALMRQGHAPTFTEAIKQGVKWKPEPPGAERFDHARKVSARGWGDCDDLAPMRAASLRVTGQDPGASAVAYKSGPGRWHAIVKRGDGRLEDPSRTAGMAVRPGSMAAGIAPAVVGMMSTGRGINGAVRPFVAVRRTDEGFIARVDLPEPGEQFAISATQKGPTPSKALAGCMAGACMVGAESRMCSEHELDRMWALHGLLKGASAVECARVCGAEATKDALLTLQDIAPSLVEELRKHWQDARILREGWERRERERNGGAAPLRDSAPRTVGQATELYGTWPSGAPGAEHMARGDTPPEWNDHLAHDRVVSPYAERFGHRGRQFVGSSATENPELEATMQPGPPGASYMAVDMPSWNDHLAHERVVSPYAERFGHRGRGFVGGSYLDPDQPDYLDLVGAATDSPYSELFRQRRTGWGMPRAFMSEQGQSEAVRELHREVSGVSLPIKPVLSFSLAGERAKHRRAQYIVKNVHFGACLDGATVGWDLFKDVIAPAGDAIGHLVSNVARGVTHINVPMHIDLGKTLSDIGKGAGQVLQAAQGVISLIPGIGTGISSAISAGLALLSGGSPLDIAVKAAYGAIPIPPGLRSATDIVVDAALSLAHTQNLADTAIATIRKTVLDRLPGPAKDIGGTVFDTLAHLVLGNVHKAPTHAVVTRSPMRGFPPKVSVIRTPAHYATLAKVAQAHAAARPAPKRVIDLHKVIAKPAPKPAVVPVHAVAPPPRPPAQAAPLTLAIVAKAFRPNVIRHNMTVPKGVRV